MDRILLRFNTKFEEDPIHRKWRVLINDHEELAHNIDIRVPCSTITEPIATGEIKHHFMCEGYVHWEDDFAAKVLNYPNFHSLTTFALGYDADSVLDQVEFSDEKYFRKSLFKAGHEGVEVVLVCLKAGQRVERHNHGKSNCVVNCLRGSFDEKLYDQNGREYNGTIGEGGLQGVKAGWEHEVTSTEEMVLLNFYSPPLDNSDG